MRWVIATVAFICPLLLAIHFAVVAVGTPAHPAIGGEGLGELRAWLITKRDVLDYYAPKPGSPDSDVVLHLALERFDRTGCDRYGNPWFRLANRPAGVSCGVLKRKADDRPVAPGRDRAPDLLMRVAGDWLYWEWKEAPESALGSGNPRQSRP